MTETHELAVMCDTFHPLKLTALAQASLDDPAYAYSWYEEPDAAKEAKNADEDPAGVTSPLLSGRTIVVDFDGTVTEKDLLDTIARDFGDPEVYAGGRRGPRRRTRCRSAR